MIITVLDPKLTGYQPLFINMFCILYLGNKKLWYLESGFSKHMTGDASSLTRLVIKHGGFVTYGDNNKGKIIGCGCRK